jgi:hypothetical protein
MKSNDTLRSVCIKTFVLSQQRPFNFLLYNILARNVFHFTLFKTEQFFGKINKIALFRYTVFKTEQFFGKINKIILSRYVIHKLKWEEHMERINKEFSLLPL